MTDLRAGAGIPAACPAAPPRATGGPVDPVPDACIEAAARAILETRCDWRPSLDPVARELAVAEARAAYAAIKAHEPNGHQWEDRGACRWGLRVRPMCRLRPHRMGGVIPS